MFPRHPNSYREDICGKVVVKSLLMAGMQWMCMYMAMLGSCMWWIAILIIQEGENHLFLQSMISETFVKIFDSIREYIISSRAAYNFPRSSKPSSRHISKELPFSKHPCLVCQISGMSELLLGRPWSKTHILGVLHRFLVVSYTHLEPKWPLFLKVTPPKPQGPNSDQNKGPHLGSNDMPRLAEPTPQISRGISEGVGCGQVKQWRLYR